MVQEKPEEQANRRRQNESR